LKKPKKLTIEQPKKGSSKKEVNRLDKPSARMQKLKKELNLPNVADI
jgi:hypothetical protein